MGGRKTGLERVARAGQSNLERGRGARKKPLRKGQKGLLGEEGGLVKLGPGLTTDRGEVKRWAFLDEKT